jgi:iron complex transport system ATP-binding protein
MSAIRLEAVTVRLGGKVVVDAVDLEIPEGEWVALIGPNGAGKTTLLRAAAGLVSYDGDVFIHERHAASLRRRELAQQIAVVPQEPLTPAWLEFRDRALGTLSGGERQRVVVARALAQEAGIVILDEPTAALDIGHQQQALELFEDLRAESQLTLVAAMHDLTLAAQYADRVALIAAGRIVADGTPDDVLTEENISAHYHASVNVVRVDDRLAVVPARAPR